MTTLDDLSDSLPNGFHDAELQRLTIDYTKREALFIVDVWIGDMSSEQREAYRLAEVALSGLLFWVAEPPDANYPFDRAGGKSIDIGPLTALADRSSLKLPPIPDGAFVNWLFVREWNAFIYVAAQGATLRWIGELTVRTYEEKSSAASRVQFPIKGPDAYYSEGDEDRFFGCLYSIPEYIDVRWDGAILQLALSTPISRASFQELVALFTRYGVPLNSLKEALPALSTEDQAYFANSEAYWFAGLFSDADPPSQG